MQQLFIFLNSKDLQRIKAIDSNLHHQNPPADPLTPKLRMKEGSASGGMITCVSFSPCTPTEGDSCTDSFAYTPPLKLFREFCRF